MTIRGIDVSNHQPANYPLDGNDFVIVKATEGTSYVNPKHNEQVDRARSHNRVVGHYHYLSASSGMTAQMDYFLDHISARNDEILAVDWEETGVSSGEKDTAIRHLQSRAGGRKVLLYCNLDFWTNRDTSSFAGDGLWVAHYNGNPGHPDTRTDWVIHQYTSDPIDTNVAEFSSRERMRAWAAGDGAEAGDDEIPKRTVFKTTGYTRTVPPGTWTTLAFNRKWEGGRWAEKDPQSTFLFGPCYYTASVGVWVTGLPRGGELQIRLANYREADDGFTRGASMPVSSPVHAGGDGHFVHTWNGFVPGADRGRARAEVRHTSDEPVTVEFARAESLYWPAG